MESQRVAPFGTSVFAEFSRLALEHQAVNLGQGFPDFDGPDEVKRAAVEAIGSGLNQYAVSTGAPALRQAVAAHAKRFYGQTANPDTEVVVTSGATEALFDAVMAFVDVGDEVVLFEPWYDSYAANVQLAGGVVKPVRLFPPQGARTTWWYDPEELAKAFSNKTRLVLVNTPHNPTGKVFAREELKEIGALATKFGAVIVSDEVYEHLVFAPAKHVRTATVDGLDERTVTISSGGKTFSFTGWKVGWAIGRPPLASAIQKVHQWVTFATAHPFQAAIAKGLALPDAYFHDFLKDYVHKRDFLGKALTSAGFRVLPCEGTYFLMADISSAGKADDLAFARWLTTEKRVVAIPPSAFYGDAHKAEAKHLARFAFCKTQAVLDQAAQRLAR